MDKREQARLRKRRQRDKESVTSDSVTSPSVTMVPASYVEGHNGRMYQSLPERPRYLELSDGQVLDRWSQPIPTFTPEFSQDMRACNESAYNYHPKVT